MLKEYQIRDQPTIAKPNSSVVVSIPNIATQPLFASGEVLDEVVQPLMPNHKRSAHVPLGLLLFLLASTTYIGILIAMLVLNSEFASNGTENGDDHIDELTFHILEFASAFAYTAIILVTTARYSFDFAKLKTDFWSFNTLGFIASFLEVCTTAASLLLIRVKFEKYEVPCHYLEYSSLLILSFLDVCVIFNNPDAKYLFSMKFFGNMILSGVGLVGAITCMSLFASANEIAAHYVEFSVDILLTINTAITILAGSHEWNDVGIEEGDYGVQ
jgi:hypothetical protein